MPRISGGPVSPAGPSKILYQEVAEVESLRAEIDQQQAASRTARLPSPDGILSAIRGPGGGPDPILPQPPLPPGRMTRFDSRELLALVRTAVQRHAPAGGSDAAARSGPTEDLIHTLSWLLRERDRLQIRLAQIRRA